jgi:hypothetical protein
MAQQASGSHVCARRRVRRTHRQRTLDALGYVALVLLVALITHKHMNQASDHASRGPEPQIATSVRVEGASVTVGRDAGVAVDGHGNALSFRTYLLHKLSH